MVAETLEAAMREVARALVRVAAALGVVAWRCARAAVLFVPAAPVLCKQWRAERRLRKESKTRRR